MNIIFYYNVKEKRRESILASKMISLHTSDFRKMLEFCFVLYNI